MKKPHIKAEEEPQRPLKAHEICKAFDISKATLFRWEREGTISPPGRDWRNWRLYSSENVAQIRKVIGTRHRDIPNI
ncbi:MAG: MerR family transcriptional regulator [Alphaproteobacteria bacterium]